MPVQYRADLIKNLKLSTFIRISASTHIIMITELMLVEAEKSRGTGDQTANICTRHGLLEYSGGKGERTAKFLSLCTQLKRFVSYY